MNIERVRAEVESEQARLATFAPPTPVPMPKFTAAPRPSLEVKLNAAAIFREAGGVLRTSTPPTLNRRTIENKHSTDVVFQLTESTRLREVLHSP